MLRAELLTGVIGPAVKMNSQQNRVNDYRALSQTVIDLRLAWVFMFIDTIVYLFGGTEATRVFHSDWMCNKIKPVFVDHRF